MKTLMVVAILAGTSPVSADEVTVVQSDWSSGAGVVEPVSEWGSGFAEVDAVAWRAVAGQLALSTTPVSGPERVSFPGNTAGAIKIWADDVDLDGDTDVLGAAHHGNELLLFVNDGANPPGWERLVLDGGFVEALAVSTADVDGDGLPDILGGAAAGAEVAWWRNLGGSPPSWERHSIDNNVPGAHDAIGADLDGDGDTDVIGVSFENDQVLWWRNDGGSPVAWQRFVIASDFDYPTKVAVADADRDGDLDLFSVAWLGEQVAWWRNDGGDPIEWTFEIIEEDFVGGHWVHTADINDDGWVDVLGAAMDLGDVAWWEMSGPASSPWQPNEVYGFFWGAVSAVTGDLDGDGDLDIASAGWHNSGRMAWFENMDGQGMDWEYRVIDNGFDQSSSVHVADVDGNGALDVLGSSWGLHELAWWRVGDFVAEGWLTSSVLDTGGIVDWVDCRWEAAEPASTLLTVEARSSSDVQEMGPWTPIAQGPGCPGVQDGARFLQYRVRLGSSSVDASPILREIEFSWEPRVAPAPRRSAGRVSP